MAAKPDPATVALDSKKGQERVLRIQTRIDVLASWTGFMAKAEASALRWVLARLAFVERTLASYRLSETNSDDCSACRELPNESPKGHRYLRTGHPRLGGVSYVHSSKCACGTSGNEVVVLQQDCAACRRRRGLEDGGRPRISQARAVEIIEEYERVESPVCATTGRIVLDGMDLDGLGIG